MRRRLARIVLVAVAVAGLATAGIGVNLLLLGYADARNDPVGKLTPRAHITRTPPPATSGTSVDERGSGELEGPDD